VGPTGPRPARPDGTGRSVVAEPSSGESTADLTAAARHRAGTGQADGLLVVAPLKIPGGTGSPVNPIWIV